MEGSIQVGPEADGGSCNKEGTASLIGMVTTGSGEKTHVYTNARTFCASAGS